MRLLIVSHTDHYRRNGEVVGWGATVREIDWLATLFDEVVHIAPLHSAPAPASALPYTSNRVQMRFVPPAGGKRIRDKIGILSNGLLYMRAILGEAPRADMVHVRCPANISLLAIVLLAVLRRPKIRWIKYAGNWSPPGREPLSYSFQRWWLRRNLARGVVTVNGQWPRQHTHVYSLLNPCLTGEELTAGRAIIGEKRLVTPVRLLFVGRIDPAKGAGRILQIAHLLKAAGLSFSLDIIGHGPQRASLEEQAAEMGLAQQVRFHGELARTALNPYFARSHLILLPSRSEGWPKVLSEAMAYGVVPIASNVGSIPQILDHIGAGRSLPPGALPEFCDAVLWYQANPDSWLAEARRGVDAAQRFSYQAYLRELESLLAISKQAHSPILD